jgi:tRNA threonylcarbamoyl adenosine modification protein (Sua5/YciO/YrdC/YwlC family)
MTQFFSIHPETPPHRLIKQAAHIIQEGGIVALPTDSCYALVCRLGDKDAIGKIRSIRQINEKHHLTLICRDLSEIATYAKIDNSQFRLLKATTPGAYTFILEATKEVPRRFCHPSRKTIGLRVPDNRIVQTLLNELNSPLIGITLILPNEKTPLTDPEEIKEYLSQQLDLIIDGGACSFEPTTVIDLTHTQPTLLRQGKGSIKPFGL